MMQSRTHTCGQLRIENAGGPHIAIKPFGTCCLEQRNYVNKILFLTALVFY